MIYFIQVEKSGPIKIGHTVAMRGIKARLQSLQSANASKLIVLATIDADFSLEAALHKKFEKSNIRGEWFTPSDDLLDFIYTNESVILYSDKHEPCGSKLREYRKANKISQAKLAAMASITQGFLSEIENKGTFSLKTAIALRDATGGAVDVDAMLRDEVSA